MEHPFHPAVSFLFFSCDGVIEEEIMESPYKIIIRYWKIRCIFPIRMIQYALWIKELDFGSVGKIP